ncbi:hypothetical protein [Peloplasma aerotolerans]|uniref:HhH-GPD domain-containing protein n=1 Tax=Peloplasma aerotolerans TaxID=3044389 RepID=A0AAW6U7E5_9MOLU|nr:hypothetical protein [Mariniplasma sp. M4Ah]MDI6452845.1 hypothetical protein [Mariniplasma sp. M4Ah]
MNLIMVNQYVDIVITNIEKMGIEFNKENNKPVYNHIGAVICDMSLQAGLNYKNVVYPRIEYILNSFASFKTTSQFTSLINIIDIEDILNFHNKRKIQTIKEIFSLLKNENIETVDEMAEWMTTDFNINQINNINGIGPKTLDYLLKLLGIDSMPVDRHLFSFLKLCNIDVIEYYPAQLIYNEVSRKLNINKLDLDTAIWNYMSKNELTYQPI